MTRRTIERCRNSLPAALLVAVACAQLWLAHAAALSPWKGGGFGMFASLDARPFRHVRIFVSARQRSEELAVPVSLELMAASVEVLPGQRQFDRLARAVVDRERRHGRPVVDVRLELWRVEFAPASLTPSQRLLASYAFHVAS